METDAVGRGPRGNPGSGTPSSLLKARCPDAEPLKVFARRMLKSEVPVLAPGSMKYLATEWFANKARIKRERR